MRKMPYHVYAEDGFESAHVSEAAARRAAERGAKRRRMTYTVVRTSVYGMTGGGHGTEVARYDGNTSSTRRDRQSTTSRDSRGTRTAHRDLSRAELFRYSVPRLERAYNDGLITKKDVVAWVRLFANKGRGNIYVPTYRTSSSGGDRLTLRRHEQAENKLLAKRATRHRSFQSRSRDPGSLKNYESIGYGLYVTPREAGRLVRAAGTRLPKPGYETRVTLPDGRSAHLSRTTHAGQQVWYVSVDYHTNHIMGRRY